MNIYPVRYKDGSGRVQGSSQSKMRGMDNLRKSRLSYFKKSCMGGGGNPVWPIMSRLKFLFVTVSWLHWYLPFAIELHAALGRKQALRVIHREGDSTHIWPPTP